MVIGAIEDGDLDTRGVSKRFDGVQPAESRPDNDDVFSLAWFTRRLIASFVPSSVPPPRSCLPSTRSCCHAAAFR